MTQKEKVDQLVKEINEGGFDGAVAIATDAEVEAGAACGQLCLVNEE
jgi:adenine C2-methylase RlmN of 23S rRNA A2503 and tRNA A37